MATPKEQSSGSNEYIEALAETIGDTLERRRAAKEEVPAVYKSGMRGNEEPPAVRKAREAREALQNKGARKGVDLGKVARTQHGRVQQEDDDQNGRRKVSFNAGPTKKALAAENAKLKKQLEELQGKGKKKITI